MAFNEALTIRGEDDVIFRRVTTDGPVWKMSAFSSWIYSTWLRMHLADNTHTYSTYTLTVHAYADGYKQAHTHTPKLSYIQVSAPRWMFRVYD